MGQRTLRLLPAKVTKDAEQNEISAILLSCSRGHAAKCSASACPAQKAAPALTGSRTGAPKSRKGRVSSGTEARRGRRGVRCRLLSCGAEPRQIGVESGPLVAMERWTLVQWTQKHRIHIGVEPVRFPRGMAQAPSDSSGEADSHAIGCDRRRSQKKPGAGRKTRSAVARIVSVGRPLPVLAGFTRRDRRQARASGMAMCSSGFGRTGP